MAPHADIGRTRSTGLVLESAYSRQRLAILHSLQVTCYAGSTAATKQSVTDNADCPREVKAAALHKRRLGFKSAEPLAARRARNVRCAA